MASPVQVPPPRYRRRSMSGPIILISIGIVFLLGTMGVLDWHNLGRWFAHYWPLLLIIAGVIKLIEHQQAQKEGTRATGLSAGGIILLIMIVVVGLIATQASRFNWGQFKDEIDINDEDFSFFGHRYTYDDHLAQAFPSGASLRVDNTRGAVNIIASEDDQISVVVRKRISADNQSEADKWNAGTKPQLNVNGNVVSLNANNGGAGDHWVAEDLDITMPRKAAVIVSTRYGDISVVGRDGNVDLTTQHGDVTASDITGKVNLKLDHSSARVSQVASDVSVEGRANDVSIEDVKGTVHMDGEFSESVKLAKLDQPVTFKSSRTDMDFSRLDGNLDLDSGDLDASELVGPLRLSTRSKDIRLAGISGDVRLQDENGSVELRMNKLGSMQVDNRQGDIQIYVPDMAGFQVDARTRNGDIESDFDQLKIDDSNDQAVATGTVGAGGPRLVVNNEHGNVEIRKASSAEESASPKAPKPPKPPKAPRAPEPPKVPQVTEN